VELPEASRALGNQETRPVAEPLRQPVAAYSGPPRNSPPDTEEPKLRNPRRHGKQQSKRARTTTRRLLSGGDQKLGGGGGSRTRVRECSPPEAYVRSRFSRFSSCLRTGKSDNCLARLSLGLKPPGRRPSTQPAKPTPSAGLRAQPARTAASQSGSVSILRVGSYCFPVVLREPGTRHAFRRQYIPVESVSPPFCWTPAGQLRLRAPTHLRLTLL